MKDIHETVHQARAGNADAFASLFSRNLPKLRAFLRLRAGGVVIQRESVSDLAQSVCREVLEDADRIELRGETEFRNYLFLEATRKVLKRYRWHRQAKRDSARESDPVDPESETGQLLSRFATLATPSRHAAAREELAGVEAAIDKLPEEQRDAVTLSRLVGLGYAEIGELLGRSESSVRGLVARGLAALVRFREATP